VIVKATILGDVYKIVLTCKEFLTNYNLIFIYVDSEHILVKSILFYLE